MNENISSNLKILVFIALQVVKTKFLAILIFCIKYDKCSLRSCLCDEFSTFEPENKLYNFSRTGLFSILDTNLDPSFQDELRCFCYYFFHQIVLKYSFLNIYWVFGNLVLLVNFLSSFVGYLWVLPYCFFRNTLL